MSELRGLQTKVSLAAEFLSKTVTCKVSLTTQAESSVTVTMKLPDTEGGAIRLGFAVVALLSLLEGCQIYFKVPEPPKPVGLPPIEEFSTKSPQTFISNPAFAKTGSGCVTTISLRVSLHPVLSKTETEYMLAARLVGLPILLAIGVEPVHE